MLRMAPPYSEEDRERRRKALKLQKSLQKETSSNNFDDDVSGSDVEDIDFTREIHPIGYYIDDREKMIAEMFSILKGEKLQRILPAILKNYTIEELKADCLVHLLGMSKKRITAILEGRDLNSSSDSETDEEPVVDDPQRSHFQSSSLEIQISKTETKNVTNKEELRHRPRKRSSSFKEDKKQQEKSISSCIVISDDELVDIKPSKEERRKILKLRNERRALKAKIEKKIKKTEKRKMKSQIQEIQVSADSNDEQEKGRSESSRDDEEDKGKSLLEILELEMRARAIRALLKNTPNVDEPVPVSILNIKPEADSKVETGINKTIAEVINEESTPRKQRNLSSPTDDVEINEVCDILTVTIDDDDDDDKIEPTPTQGTIAEKTVETSDTTIVKAISAKSVENVSDPNKDDATWSERWIESKGVKEVMKNNKLCANIRKRMRFARMLKEKQSQAQGKEKSNNNLQDEILSSLNTVEESSVAQYELIKSLDKLKSANEEAISVAHQSSCSNEESSTIENKLRSSNKESSTVEDG